MTRTAPRAIETEYAGCMFRSRLEAKWAVFFDHYGITWQYEREGYELTERLDPFDEPASFRYLPDFWLPEQGLHFEVKGNLDGVGDVRRLLNAAAALSCPGSGCGEGPDLVVAGPIPKQGDPFAPIALHMHKGDLLASAWDPEHRSPHCFPGGWELGYIIGAKLPWTGSVAVARDVGAWPNPLTEVRMDDECTAMILLNGAPAKRGQAWHDALDAARKARFEHGQSGAPGRP